MVYSRSTPKTQTFMHTSSATIACAVDLCKRCAPDYFGLHLPLGIGECSGFRDFSVSVSPTPGTLLPSPTWLQHFSWTGHGGVLQLGVLVYKV